MQRALDSYGLEVACHAISRTMAAAKREVAGDTDAPQCVLNFGSYVC